MNKKPKDFTYFIPEKKCRKCGKIFIPGADHIYRDHSKWYCCWTCYLHRKDKVSPPDPDKEEFIIPNNTPWPNEKPSTNKTKED